MIALDEIPSVYRTDTEHRHTTLEHYIITLPPLLLKTGEEESTTKPIMILTTLIIVTFTIQGIMYAC